MIVRKGNFKPEKTIVACHIICNGEMLLLLRHKERPQGSKYGVVAGKVDEGETVEDALVREIKEEVGLSINTEDLEFQKIFNVKYKEYSFSFHLYNLYFDSKPTITVNNKEHTNYIWCKPEDALKLDLIEDEDSVIKEVFSL